MTISEVKKALGQRVRFRGAVYIFSGCVIRKDESTQQFFYQAELLDTTTNNSIVIARLEEVDV